MVQYKVTYLKTKNRMPVRPEPVIYPRDIQQDLPPNWCAKCRRELYDAGQLLCRRCKGGYYESSNTEPLP